VSGSFFCRPGMAGRDDDDEPVFVHGPHRQGGFGDIAFDKSKLGAPLGHGAGDGLGIPY